MEIKGKVHCFFEQSGTFKREFIKLGIPAEDYDIQNNFGETDHVIDLFAEIEKAYEGGGKSVRYDNHRRFNHGFLPVHILQSAEHDILRCDKHQLEERHDQAESRQGIGAEP